MAVGRPRGFVDAILFILPMISMLDRINISVGGNAVAKEACGPFEERTAYAARLRFG